MKEVYRLRFLARIGVVVMVAVAFWLVVARFIPTFHAPQCPEWEGQLFTIRHQDIRDNNPLYTNLLLTSVKRNDGWLVLGTSETNARPNGNYYDFLNTDTALRCGFSVIAGAGRTACTYFPLIQSNENVRGLKVLFFLNPSYGCGKLAYSNEDYFSRYVSSAVCREANRPVNEDVERILQANLPKLNWGVRVGEWLACHTDRLRRKYSQDLAFSLNPSKFGETLTWLDSAMVSRLPDSCARPDSSRYNYELNVGASFDVHSYKLRPHPESSYRADELRTMIRLCKARGVDIVYIAGPYNEIAYRKVYPQDLPDIQQVSAEMLKVLDEEGAAYIDCTDLSAEPGVFADWQHHTSYGAYRIYQKIKNYVLEKENR